MKVTPPEIRHNNARNQLITTGLLLVIILLIFHFKEYPTLVEKYYSQAFYPLVRSVWQVTGLIPFSLGDIFYILVVAGLVWSIIKMAVALWRGYLHYALSILLSFVIRLELLTIAFYMLWALHYFRVPARERLQLPTTGYDEQFLKEVTGMLIDSLNLSRKEIQTIADEPDLVPSIKAMYSLRNFEPPQQVTGASVKGSLLSPLVSYFGTAGYFNPFTGEAQYNSKMPAFTVPFIACHEMAHQIGFGSEDEASFIAFVAGKSSPNPMLRYSSYYHATQEFMSELSRTDSLSFKLMKNRLSADVLADLKREQEFWKQYHGDAARLSSIFYDNYLKANKQPEGLMTYNRMTRLTMAYYRRLGLIFPKTSVPFHGPE